MLLLCSVTMPAPLVSVHTPWRLYGTRLSITQDRVDLAEPLFVISRWMLRVRMIHDASIANSDTRLQMGGLAAQPFDILHEYATSFLSHRASRPHAFVTNLHNECGLRCGERLL